MPQKAEHTVHILEGKAVLYQHALQQVELHYSCFERLHDFVYVQRLKVLN
ncbi:hypothetical protein MCEGE14_02771 [Burkholderiaceae bacterium]